MTQVVEAVYENGVLKPLSPVDLSEHQHVQITIADSSAADLSDVIDHEYMESVRAEVARRGPAPSLEEVREIFRKSPGPSLSEIIIQEREERF